MGERAPQVRRRTHRRPEPGSGRWSTPDPPYRGSRWEVTAQAQQAAPVPVAKA